LLSKPVLIWSHTFSHIGINITSCTAPPGAHAFRAALPQVDHSIERRRCIKKIGVMKIVAKESTFRKLGLLIGVTCILVVSVAAIAMLVTVVLERDQQRQSSADWIEHTQQVLVAIGTVLMSAEDVETGQRGFLLTNDAAFLESYDDGIASAWRSISELKHLTADNPGQLQRLERWVGLLRAKLTMVAGTIELARGGDVGGAIDIVRSGTGRVLMHTMRSVAAEMVAEEQILLRQRHMKRQELEHWTMGILAGLLIIAAGGILLCGAMATRVVLGNAAKVRAAMAATELHESEARLRLLADHVSPFVWIADEKGSVRWFNQRWYDYTGSMLEEVQGWGWQSALHPDDVAAVTERMQYSFDTGLPWEDTFPLRGRDGQYRWFLSRALPVRNVHGVIDRWFGTNTDVTEQHEASTLLTRSHEGLERQAIEHAAALTHEIEEHHSTEMALRQSEEHTRLALSAVNSIGTYNRDLVNDRVYGNASFARIFGINPDHAAAGAPVAEYLVNVPADARAKMLLEYERAMRTGGDCSVIHPVNQADGSVLWCLARSHCTLALDGTPLRISGILIDITEQRNLEEQFRQSQKMEAVGQLTGGLAHDFNNMLQGITGSLELLRARLGAGHVASVDRYITAAQSDAARAATLTQRLLAFSRRQLLDPEPTNSDDLIAGMVGLIQRTVGPGIKVVVVPTINLWTTLCDANQMENALLNLCINARDAMPNGGGLTIETANVLLDRRGASDWDVMPGEYVAVCVTDTGAGMPLDVVARAFDPFFTTKALGVGTGLGLSMIYGFAQQSGGQARINSEVGVGTTVRIYLPRHLGETKKKQASDEVEEAPRAEAGQTVLIVDDEPTVRMLVTAVLQEHGYTAVEAVDGASGLKILQSNARIDLLISDVGLPGGMNGWQMADAARIVRPDLKVLFITGYAPNAAVGNGRLAHGMQVMTKPFALEALGIRIKALISSEVVVA
jgi:PAS domain S-box-containing protein